MTPTIRPITEEEKTLAQALYRNAYKISTELSQRWTMLADLSITRAVVDEGRVLSILTIKPFEVWIGGRLMKMGGISGVATWADQQGKGYAGQLVRHAIEDMREAGQSISVLYPFAFRYYGRFGYELAGEYISYSGVPADYAAGPVDENVHIRAANLDVDLPQIKECYAATAARWNTMVKRDDDRWEWWKKYFTEDLKQVYVVETIADRRIVGHFGIMDQALPDGGYESTVTGLVFQDDRHYENLGRFLRRLPKNVKKVKLIAGHDQRLWHLFVEPSVETKIHSSHQARMVDVEAACRERGYAPGVDEDVSFAITDESAPWNSGTWRLKVKDGQGEIARTDADGAAVPLTIQQFSTIFVGYRQATEYALAVPGHTAALAAMDRIFFDRPPRLLDFF